MNPRRYELTDFEWSIIAPLLPNKPRGVPRADDRKVLNGIYWRLRTGSPWADIPERYGMPITIKLTEGQAHDRPGSLGEHPADRPQTGPARVSPFLYRYRNLVERFFNKLKH